MKTIYEIQFNRRDASNNLGGVLGGGGGVSRHYRFLKKLYECETNYLEKKLSYYQHHFANENELSEKWVTIKKIYVI